MTLGVMGSALRLKTKEAKEAKLEKEFEAVDAYRELTSELD